MSSWKHDRTYYSQNARNFAKFALFSFIFSSIFWSIFFLSNFQTNYWLGGTLLCIIGLIFLRLRNINLRNSYRAPSRI